MFIGCLVGPNELACRLNRYLHHHLLLVGLEEDLEGHLEGDHLKEDHLLGHRLGYYLME